MGFTSLMRICVSIPNNDLLRSYLEKMNPSYLIQFISLLWILGSAQVVKYSNTMLYLAVYQDISQAIW